MPAFLGKQIRELRKEQKFTLKEIAERTGVSISFLSQLEHGKTSATLESIKKISDALGVNPSYFFQQDGKPEQTSIIRASTYDANLTEESFVYINLANQMPNPLFSPVYIILKPGDNRGDLFTHKGQEFIFVLEGTLTVLIENEEHILKENDSIFFDASKPHYWMNHTSKDIKFLCVAAEKN